MCLTNKFLKLKISKLTSWTNIQRFSSDGFNRHDLKVLFFGADNFSLPSLKILTKNYNSKGRIKELGVVTSKKTPTNCVQRFAEKQQIEMFNWPIEQLVKNYDIGVVVSFGHLIPIDIINSFPMGMINVHASLLPKWRGASPIIYSILNGDSKTGVTIMKIRPHHYDIGEIIAQKEVNIPIDILMPELHKTLADEGSKLLLECLNNIPESLDNAKSQSQEDISYAPKVQQSLTIINWNKMTAKNIFNLYRALYTYKYIITHWHKYLIKLIHINYDSSCKLYNNNEHKSGTFIYSKQDKCLIVYCECDYIKIYQLQVEGKKVMSALEFHNGFVKKKSKENHFFN